MEPRLKQIYQLYIAWKKWNFIPYWSAPFYVYYTHFEIAKEKKKIKRGWCELNPTVLQEQV